MGKIIVPPRFFCFLPLLPLELLLEELLPLELLPLELLPLELLPRSLDARRKISFRAMPGFLSRTSFTNSIHVLGSMASALTILYDLFMLFMSKGEKIYLKSI